MLKQAPFYLVASLNILLCVTDSNFGPFNMFITSITICPGPKPKDCAMLKANVTGNTTIYLNLQVTKNCSPSKGKILATSNGKELVRFQMSKPCDHLFLRPLFEAMYNVTKNCQILKGDYSRKVDIGQIASSYFGGSFFYGNLTFRSLFYNDECNFSCAILKVSMTPKK